MRALSAFSMFLEFVLGGLAEGFWGRLEELFGFGEADLVGGEAGDFGD
jgi:hypothetical protein